MLKKGDIIFCKENNFINISTSSAFHYRIQFLKGSTYVIEDINNIFIFIKNRNGKIVTFNQDKKLKKLNEV